MAEALTSVLEVVAVLLIAAGTGWLVSDVANPGWGFIAAGLLVLACSALAAVLRRRGGDRR